MGQVDHISYPLGGPLIGGRTFPTFISTARFEVERERVSGFTSPWRIFNECGRFFGVLVRRACGNGELALEFGTILHDNKKKAHSVALFFCISKHVYTCTVKVIQRGNASSCI